jgi:nucleoside-diphosphate-sugar epimerase
MLSMLNGRFKFGAPELYFGTVDVRDVAKSHVLAGTIPEASGRHILCADVLSFLDMAALLRKYYPEYPLPPKPVPKWILYLVGPFMGFSWKYVSQNIGISMQFDNSYSKQDLGLDYTSPEVALRDHAEQLIKDGLV